MCFFIVSPWHVLHHQIDDAVCLTVVGDLDDVAVVDAVDARASRRNLSQRSRFFTRFGRRILIRAQTIDHHVAGGYTIEIFPPPPAR